MVTPRKLAVILIAVAGDQRLPPALSAASGLVGAGRRIMDLAVGDQDGPCHRRPGGTSAMAALKNGEDLGAVIVAFEAWW